MTDELLRYSSLIIFRPSSDWKLEVLCFYVDQQVEFLQQWVSQEDDPLRSVMLKMKRITGRNPVVVSIDPIHTISGESLIDYYACTVVPYSTFPKTVQYYDRVAWMDPKSIYLLLSKDTDRLALRSAIRWIYAKNSTPLIVTRNQMMG